MVTGINQSDADRNEFSTDAEFRHRYDRKNEGQEEPAMMM